MVFIFKIMEKKEIKINRIIRADAETVVTIVDNKVIKVENKK